MGERGKETYYRIFTVFDFAFNSHFSCKIPYLEGFVKAPLNGLTFARPFCCDRICRTNVGSSLLRLCRNLCTEKS